MGFPGSINWIVEYWLLDMEFLNPEARGTLFIVNNGLKLGLLGLNLLIPITE